MLSNATPFQTTYPQYMIAGQAGMPATETGWDADTYFCEDPTSPAEGIGFGLAVTQGTANDKSAVLGELSGGRFLGVTLRNGTLPNLVTTLTDKYSDTDNMGVLVRGDIWVPVSADVDPGDAVHFDSTTGVFGPSGGTTVKNAQWMTSSSTAVNPRSGGLAILRITHPTDQP